MEIPELQPGDCLLYWGNSLFEWAIALKTWSKVAHVEIYRGEAKSVASRNGIGVGKYPLRTEGLSWVLRPETVLSIGMADSWFFRVQGQKYDWLGLLCFTLAVRQGSPYR